MCFQRGRTRALLNLLVTWEEGGASALIGAHRHGVYFKFKKLSWMFKNSKYRYCRSLRELKVRSYKSRYPSPAVSFNLRNLKHCSCFNGWRQLLDRILLGFRHLLDSSMHRFGTEMVIDDVFVTVTQHGTGVHLWLQHNCGAGCWVGGGLSRITGLGTLCRCTPRTPVFFASAECNELSCECTSLHVCVVWWVDTVCCTSHVRVLHNAQSCSLWYLCHLLLYGAQSFQIACIHIMHGTRKVTMFVDHFSHGSEQLQQETAWFIPARDACINWCCPSAVDFQNWHQLRQGTIWWSGHTVISSANARGCSDDREHVICGKPEQICDRVRNECVSAADPFLRPGRINCGIGIMPLRT